MITDWLPRNPGLTLLRWIFAAIDQVIYGLLSIMYQIFFAVSGVDILGGDIVRSIYARVQIILGVFMVFKLAVSILQGIVSPDAVLDKKRGMGTIVTRIVVSLLMLTLMAPLNISANNEWEKQVNNNGLLFGTLFSLQNRILSNNTIGRLIVGSNAADEMTSTQNLKEVGRLFSNTVLKTFIFPNVVEDTNNKVCPNLDSSILQIYNDKASAPGEVLSLVNIGCDTTGGGVSLFGGILQDFVGEEQYAFSYYLGLSTIAGIVIVVILIGYTVDVAVRVFKLAILRLVAPVPIISHINISAKEGKGEDAFSVWTRSLISTYLDLFIRLAVIYLVLFFIQAILVNGFEWTSSHGSNNFIIKTFVNIFIILGLMLFAKQAPKYIKSVLGIKPGPSSVGLTALTAIAGNLRGGQTDAKKIFASVNENVAENSFGDKSKTPGHGLYYNISKKTADKIADKNQQGLVTEYYKRALDVDESVIAGDEVLYSGADHANRAGKWWQSKDARDALTEKKIYSNNNNRYTAQRMSTPDLAGGRGNTVRGSINTNTPPVYGGRARDGSGNPTYPTIKNAPRNTTTTPPPSTAPSSSTPPTP